MKVEFKLESLNIEAGDKRFNLKNISLNEEITSEEMDSIMYGITGMIKELINAEVVVHTASTSTRHRPRNTWRKGKRLSDF